MNDKDTRADSTDVDSIDKPIAEESTMSAEEHTNPDVDDTNITTHYRDKKRARAATEELNKLNLSPSTKAQESSEAENENDPAVEPTVDTVETPLEEADAATKLTAGWRRVKAVPDINRSKREAEKRRTDTDAKLRLMRERIQAAYARQKQNAAAERMTENNDVPVSGVLGVDIELPGAVNAVDIDLTEPVPSSEAGGRPKSLTPEEALEAARIKVRKDLEEAMGGKSASGGEAAPSESGSDLNSSTEKITPESSDSEKLDEPVIIEDVGVTPMRGSQRSRESAEDIDFTEVDPASTEEQKNSAEEMLKELQKAYENGTYNTPEFAQLFPEFAADLEAAGGDRKAAMGLLLSKYEKLNQKVVEQRRKERHEKVAKIAQRFEAEFKISPEELASIEGVETLSEAQQKLLFENFTQLTLGNVREEAASLTANFTAEQRKAAVGTYGKVLGNAFAGIREAFTKSKNELANEKAVAKQQREGGFAAHRELLTELVQGMVENGPAVTEKDGELVIDLVNLSPEERGAEDSVVARAAALLSQEANAFARTPATGRTTLGVDEIKEKPGLGARFGRWLSTSKNDRNNQEQFLNAATAFESAKAGLTEALREQGLSDIQIAQRLLEVDTKVSQQQMLMTDPNAIEALAAIEDKSFWKETAKNFAKGNGLYFGLGFVGRTALGATGGVFAMPLVAAGVASLRSWDASAATLRERDRNQRAGVEESGPGALNVVSAERLIEKTERLIERANNPDASEEERQQALNSLRVRTEYIQDKMLLGRVSYGKKAEAVRSQTELAKLLGEAMTLLTAEEQNFRTAMADRYERLTGKLDSQQTRAEDRITDERSQYRSDHLTTSAYKASLFSIAGMALGAIADEAGTGNKMGEYLKDTKTRVSTWWEGTPLGGVVSGVEKLKELQGAEGGGVPPAEGIPPQAGEESVEAARAYTIERGDTLTKILKEQVLGEKVRPTGAELARFFDSLSAEELQSIGVRSDDADLIFAGETINTEKLQELWEGRNESISAVEESETDRLNRAAEIRTTVTPLEEKVPTEPFDIDETAASATAETDIDRSSAAESLNENLRSTPEVTADIITKLRARDIGKHLLETYRIEPNEWETLRVVKVRDVLDVAAKKDSWIDILGGTRIPKVGMDIRNLETVIEQAAEPGINIKPYSTETVEMFMLRLSTKLAEVQNPEKLPLFLKNIMKAFNEKTRTEIV